jgi:hypothetical protein
MPRVQLQRKNKNKSINNHAKSEGITKLIMELTKDFLPSTPLLRGQNRGILGEYCRFGVL